MNRPPLLIALALVSTSSSASGFRVPEISPAGVATASALVANEKEIGAIPYNPAAAGFQTGSGISVGIIGVVPRASVNPAGGRGPVDVQGNAVHLLPSLTAFGPLAGNFSWSLNIDAPFGLQTVWPAGTFPRLAGPLTAVHPEESKIVLVRINPNIAYRITPELSVAVGADHYMIKRVVFNSQTTQIKGDGEKTGWALSALYASGPFSMGAAYRSAVEVPIAGAVGTVDANTNFGIPWTFQVGAKYQFAKQWALEFDIDRAGWNRFQSITVTSSANGAPLVISTNDWRNSNAYRLSALYDWTDKTQFRFGYARDRRAQPDARFSARIPDSDRNLLGAGIRHLTGPWTLEASYLYMRADRRTYTSAVPFGTYGADANGTNVYNGTYESDAHLLSFGLSRSF